MAMRFVLFLLAALIGLTGCSRQGGTGTQQITVAGVTCLQPTWHVGEFDPTGVMTHKFTLLNETDSPISIAKIRSDCDCVVAREKAKEIPARGEVEIEVSLNISPRPGPIARKIVVQLETKPTEVIPLTIVGYAAATRLLYAVPSVLDFGILHRDETQSRKVRVMRYDGSVLGELSVDSDKLPLHSSHIDVMNDGRMAEISVVVSGEATSGGEFSDRLIISTRDPKSPSVVVPIRGRTQNPADAFVSSVYVESMQPAMEKTIPLLRENVGGADCIRIERLDYDGAPVINVRVLDVGENTALTLLLDEGAREGNLYAGMLSVSFYLLNSAGDANSAGAGRLEIPVFVYCGKLRI